MTAQQDPNLGLFYGWALMEDNWNQGMDSNLKKLGSLVQLSVKSRQLTSEPASPVEGDRYIVASPASGAWTSQENNLAVYINGTWEFHTPKVGWHADVQDELVTIRYNGTSWQVAFATYVKNNFSATVDPTTTNDSSQGYALNSTWVNTTTSEVFRCIDATVNAAVWIKTSLTIDELGAVAVEDVVPVSKGGTGSTTPSAARAALGAASLDANGEVVEFPAVLRTLAGNINDPLVHIPFRRANDELRLSGMQTFTRASTATYVDPVDGLIKTAQNDAPRFEKMADGGVGILLEGSSTNLLLHSESFDDATWAKTGIAVTPDVVVGPDGNTTADKINANAADSYMNQIATLTPGDTVTFSVWLRSVTGDITLNIRIVKDGAGFVANTVTLTTEWQRVSVTGIVPSGGTTYGVRIGGGNTFSTGESIYAWGAQLEALPFASSYIPTTTAPVTRAVDHLAIVLAGNRPGYADDYTFVVDYDKLGNPSLGDSSRLITPDFASQASVFHTGNGNNLSTYYNFYHTTTSSTFIPHVTHRVVVRVRGKNVSIWRNGVVEYSESPIDTSITQQGGSTIYIGADRLGIQPLYGHIRSLRIYDRALTDVEIMAA